MRAIRYAMVAAKLTFGLVTVAQAHPFIGVGITGGPVFPVASSAQSAPPLGRLATIDHRDQIPGGRITMNRSDQCDAGRTQKAAQRDQR